MATFRISKKGNYSAISNEPINDKALSWGARGMLTYLLSKPDNWTVRTADLIRQSPAGRDATQSIINELKEAGYLVRSRSRKDDGTFGWETLVYESPTMNGLSVDGSTVDGKPVDVVKTESPITESKDSSADADAPPVKEKTEYILRSEAMEETFAKALGVPTPDWEKQPAAANKRWRLPLNRMLKETIRFGLPDRVVLTGIKSCVRQMRDDKLTFDAPDQIEKVFGAWLVNQRNGEGGPAYASRNLSAEYREKTNE